MRTGRVLRFDEARGYGFIAPEGGGEDVFVHVNELLDDKSEILPGTPVEFEVTESDRGLKAYAVRVLERRPRRSAEVTDAQVDEDGLCDVLSGPQFQRELTELLLKELPDLTGRQIVQLRRSLLTLAEDHGWVET
jgi:cold shock protein